jgi:hypothetical protein
MTVKRRWVPAVALVIAAIGAAFAIGFGATELLANTGPVTTRIASSGGYNVCISGIAQTDHYGELHSVSGERQPYVGAIYTVNNSVIASSGAIHNDAWQVLWEKTSQVSIVRIDNQFATSGNGLYECEGLS